MLNSPLFSHFLSIFLLNQCIVEFPLCSPSLVKLLRKPNRLCCRPLPRPLSNQNKLLLSHCAVFPWLDDCGIRADYDVLSHQAFLHLVGPCVIRVDSYCSAVHLSQSRPQWSQSRCFCSTGPSWIAGIKQTSIFTPCNLSLARPLWNQRL